MAISMSERDYATLEEAAAWLKLHSGFDAPEYPALDRLTTVIDAIARRRPSLYDPLRAPGSQGRCSELVASLLDLGDSQAR